GATGTPVRWVAFGPIPQSRGGEVVKKFGPVPAADSDPAGDRPLVYATDSNTRIALGTQRGDEFAPRYVWFAYTDVAVANAGAVEFIVSGGASEVWLNGESIFQRAEGTGSARFTGDLVKGHNRVLVRATAPAGAAVEFQLSFRKKSATAAHEKLTQLAL